MKIDETGDTLPFLKAKAIKNPITAKILACKSAEGSEFSDYYLDVKTPRGPMRLGLKKGGQNIQELVKRFGKESDKWIGKSIRLKRDTFKDHDYVRVA